MAKKDTGLKATLSLSPKVPIKSTPVDLEKTEAATKKLHSTSPKREGKWFRITADLPEDEFIKFKTKLISQGKARGGQDVVRDLIKTYSEDG
jgi:hypothetical protein